MPIFEYQCNQCGAQNEFIVAHHSASDALQCKACGSADLKKLLSIATTPAYPGPKDGKTCCGRDEKCGGGTPCCGT
jgi:putative FmdB family regulatory protein